MFLHKLFFSNFINSKNRLLQMGKVDIQKKFNILGLIHPSPQQKFLINYFPLSLSSKWGGGSLYKWVQTNQNPHLTKIISSSLFLKKIIYSKFRFQKLKINLKIGPHNSISEFDIGAAPAFVNCIGFQFLDMQGVLLCQCVVVCVQALNKIYFCRLLVNPWNIIINTSCINVNFC